MLKFPLFLSGIVAIAAGSFAGAAEIPAAALQWQCGKDTQKVERDGKSFIVVRVPATATPQEIDNTHYASAVLNLKAYAGHEFKASINLRTDAVSKPPKPFNGVKFQLHIRNQAGKNTYAGPAVAPGTNDWKTYRITQVIPEDADTAFLRLGLQQSSGEAEFALNTLKITVDAPQKDPAPTQLSPQEAAEMDLITKRMREADLPPAGKLIQTALVREWLAAQQPDGAFADVDYRDANRSIWQTSKHTDRLRGMARAWADPRHELHHDAALGKGISSGLAWWAKHTPRNPNWWWNDLYLPQTLSATLLLVPELCPPGPVRDSLLKVCRQSKLTENYTGDNRLFCAANIFRRALVERNLPLARQNAAIVLEEVAVVPSEGRSNWLFGGARSDGSYHQHGPQIQFGNYGGSFLSSVAYWANMWKDTEFALTPVQWEVMRNLVFNGYRWVIWDGRMDLLAIGRHLGKGTQADKGGGALRAIERLAAADPQGPAAYQGILDGNRTHVNPVVGNRHFWQSDYMVHRRPNWFASFRANSVRVRPLEDDVNHDNPLGRYFSDGAIEIMIHGNEYQNITACWDWTRLPGTTLPATPLLGPEECRARGLKIASEPARFSFGRGTRGLGETEFVGGVTDGTHGAAIFTQDVDQVKAKKAAFFDTDQIILLGSGIDSASPYPVATTVNTAIRNGEVAQGPDWIWHDRIGYRGKDLKLTVGKRQGDWRYVAGGIVNPAPEEKELFQLGIEHGVKCRNAAYAVQIVPDVTAANLEKVPPAEILANTPELQAVKFRDGTIAAIFHAPGKWGNFSTATPGLFLIGKDKIYAAEPTEKVKTMTVNGRKVTPPTGEKAGTTFEIAR